jgi:hypothetical protein
MRKLWLLSLLILASASVGLAQNSDDYHKWEVYGGYSLGRFESNVRQASFTSSGGTQTFTNLCSPATGGEIGPNFQRFFCSRRNFNGFDGSITYNVSKYIGIKGDFTGHLKSQTFIDKFTPPGVTQTISNRERLYNFLGGIQIKNNTREARQAIRSRARGIRALYEPSTTDARPISALMCLCWIHARALFPALSQWEREKEVFEPEISVAHLIQPSRAHMARITQL